MDRTVTQNLGDYQLDMTKSTKTLYRSYIIEEYHFEEEPYY